MTAPQARAALSAIMRALFSPEATRHLNNAARPPPAHRSLQGDRRLRRAEAHSEKLFRTKSYVRVPGAIPYLENTRDTRIRKASFLMF